MEQQSLIQKFFSALMGGALIALMGYFVFATWQGEFGMFRLFQVQATEAQLQTELDALRAQRADLENKTHRLSNQYLDLDLLDEQARQVLGMARGDEIIIR